MPFSKLFIWLHLDVFNNLFSKITGQKQGMWLNRSINTFYHQPNGKLKNSFIWGQRAILQCNVPVQNCIVKSRLGLSLILLQGTAHCLVVFHSTEFYWWFGEAQMINAGAVVWNKQILLIHYGIVDLCTNSGETS